MEEGGGRVFMANYEVRWFRGTWVLSVLQIKFKNRFKGKFKGKFIGL